MFFTRSRLAARWLGPDILDRARGEHLKKHLANNDILDAIAALWTAHRIENGTYETLPESVLVDATGLPMRIVF